jgi:excisionase family DNA binding protein
MIAAAVPVGHLLTPDQVAKRLSVSRSMVYAEIKKARMKALYVGRFARTREDLDDGTELRQA